MQGARNDAVSLSILANGSNTQLRSYYDACVNNGIAPGQSQAPLVPLLAAIARCQSNDLPSVMKAVAALHAAGVPALFAPPRPADDLSTGLKNLLQLVEGGLGLPGPDYYTSRSYAALRTEYTAHVTKMLQLLTPGASTDGAHVVSFEAALARAWVAQTGDFLKSKAAYNPMSANALAKETGLPWAAYLSAVSFNMSQTLNLVHPPFFEALAGMLLHTSSTTLQAYLRWQLAHALSPALPPKFARETWSFFGQVRHSGRRV